MALPLYLAMTEEEMAYADSLPALGAAMTCHFALYGTGLEALPSSLPEGWMVVLNDRVPVWNHDPGLVARQLMDLSPAGVLLDFQRQADSLGAAMVKGLAEQLVCPVGVSQLWADNLDCPVLVSPLPLTVSLSAHLSPWDGREIWLDVSSWGEKITVTTEGSTATSLPVFSTEGICHREEKLHCHYRTEVFEDRAEFTLYRTAEDIAALLVEAEELGVTRIFGLWSELKGIASPPP